MKAGWSFKLARVAANMYLCLGRMLSGRLLTVITVITGIAVLCVYYVYLQTLAASSKSVSNRQGFRESVIRQPIIQDNNHNMAARGKIYRKTLNLFSLHRHKIGTAIYIMYDKYHY